jgi:hypothetical protein
MHMNIFMCMSFFNILYLDKFAMLEFTYEVFEKKYVILMYVKTL